MAQHKLYIIRHATSEYNAASQEWVATHGTRKNMPLKWDPQYIDSPLTPSGIAEAESAKPAFANLHLSKILVSPLRRALHTCDILFSDLAERPPIKVCPLITEKCGNAPDLSLYCDYPFPKFAYFDWSDLIGKPDYWLLDVIFNQETARIRTEATSKPHAKTLMLQAMKELYPEKLEAKVDVYRRSEIAKEYLQRELVYGNVAIVTHSNFTKHFTKQVFGEGKWLANCGVLECSLDN